MTYEEEIEMGIDESIVRPRKARKARKTRAAKLENGIPATHKEKFAVEEIYMPEKGMEFHPRSDNQKRFLRYMREGRKLIWGIGAVGAGKSIVAAYHAAQMLKERKTEKVFLLRPNVSCGKSHGAVPGDLHAKLLILFGQTICHLEKFLGKGFTKYCLDKKIIELASIEYLRGYSFENCVVILEECQGLTEDQYEMVLTRVGQNACLISTGDERQAHISEQSGLRKTITMLENAVREQPEYLDQQDLSELYNNVGVVEFTFDDIQRDDITRALAKLYYHK